MFPRNQWYAFGWDYEVGRAPIGRRICNEPIVVYRRLDGTPVALEDACPHRLLPMSAGRVEGDNIRCGYHGLLMSSSGETLEMPGGDPPRPHICGKSYSIIEKHRFVWVWIGDQEKASPELIPDLWPCSAQGWVFDGGYKQVGCDYRLLIDNLMDLTHETYVHLGSLGQPELMEVPMDTRVEDDSVIVSRWMPGVEAPPFWKNALKREGAVNRWQICRFVEPSSIMIDVGVSPVEAGDTLEQHDSGVRGVVINVLTPESDTSTHYFWGMARNFEIHDPGVTARLKAQQSDVFDEDVVVLEMQQNSIQRNSDLRLRTLSIDAGGAHARSIIANLASAT